MYVQVILHFILTQCRPLLLFYIGLRSHLAMVVYWNFTHITVDTLGEVLHRHFNTTLGENLPQIQPLGLYLDCILAGSYSMLTSFEGDYSAKCIGKVGNAQSLYGLPVSLNQFFTGMNVLGLMIVIMFIIVLTCELVASGVKDFVDASYLTFTFRVQKTKPYKVMSYILVAFALTIMLDMARFLHRVWRVDPHDLFNFCEYLLPTLLSLVYSAVALAQGGEEPFLDYNSEDFLQLKFERGWSSVLVDNNDFCSTLGISLLKAQYKQPQELKEMVPAGSDLDEVIWACRPVLKVSDSDADSDDSSGADSPRVDPEAPYDKLGSGGGGSARDIAALRQSSREVIADSAPTNLTQLLADAPEELSRYVQRLRTEKEVLTKEVLNAKAQ